MDLMNSKVDFFFTNENKWRGELDILRQIILDCGLTEELKWGCPCYKFEKGNVVLIHAFEEYCVLLFIKGTLLKDPKGILVQERGNLRSARQIRFTNICQILELEPVLKAYVREAIAARKAGLKVEFKKASEYGIPDEFHTMLDAAPDLKTAFEALTPGRQRAYLLHFSSARQSKPGGIRVDNGHLSNPR